MTDIKTTSDYLQRPSLSLYERMAEDARAAGLCATVSADHIMVSNLTIRSFRALRVVIDVMGEPDPDKAYRKIHGERVEARRLANSPWPHDDKDRS